MISSVTGELKSLVGEDRLTLKVGPFVLEVMIPAIDLPELQQAMGREITLHTVLHLQSDGGNTIEPQLLGFLRREDRAFFEQFVTVKGIGPRTALRALTVSPGEIAHAIESRDARFLQSLKGIGKRTAELIIAELSGKVSALVSARATTIPARSSRAPVDEDAIAALVQLGERRPDAEALLDRARQSIPKAATADLLVREMLRLRTSR